MLVWGGSLLLEQMEPMHEAESRKGPEHMLVV